MLNKEGLEIRFSIYSYSVKIQNLFKAFTILAI